MKKFFFILSLFLIFNCVQYEKNLKDKSEVLPFKMVNNLPIVQAELNGISAKFLIDSGAALSALDLNAMYIYGYSIDRFKPVTSVSGIGGSQPLYYLKNYEFKPKLNDTIDVIFKGMDLRNFRDIYGILGILGSDYMEQHNLEIDYEKKVIRKR